VLGVRGLGKESFTITRAVKCPKTFLGGDTEDAYWSRSLETHQHDVIYYGVVNLVHESKIIGTIDVWRCRACQELFCEDKRFGATDLAPEVGFPKIDAGAKWAALICTRDNGSTWTLMGVKPGATIAHSCTPETKLELSVGPDYSLGTGPSAGIGKHRIILIDKFVNAAVDVLTGEKHLGTTDAYQALGKPFSFTPPLSAAVVQSSKLAFFNLASVLFFAISLGLLLAGGSVFAGFNRPGTLESSILLLLGLLGLVGGYFTFRKSQYGPSIAMGVALAGLIGYTALRASNTALSVSDIVLDAFLVLGVLVGWLASTRLRTLKRAQWHTLDMPTYG